MRKGRFSEEQDAQVWGTFESCKSSFNPTKLQRNFNNIGVRSFILTGEDSNPCFRREGARSCNRRPAQTTGCKSGRLIRRLHSVRVR